MKALEEIRTDKGNSAAIFNLKDRILGKKKSTQEQIVIINPENDKEWFP